MKSFQEMFKERLAINVRKEGKSALQATASYLGFFAFGSLLVYLYDSAAHQPDTARKNAMMALSWGIILLGIAAVSILAAFLSLSLAEAYKEFIEARRSCGKLQSSRRRMGRYSSAVAVIMGSMVLFAVALGDQVRVENLRQFETEDDDWETIETEQEYNVIDWDTEWNSTKPDPTPRHKEADFDGYDVDSYKDDVDSYRDVSDKMKEMSDKTDEPIGSARKRKPDKTGRPIRPKGLEG